MANFDSGVAKYVKAKATIKVNFPVDFKGNEDINCFQCNFFSRSTGICYLNKQIPAYPSKYVGQDCPLELDEE